VENALGLMGPQETMIGITIFVLILGLGGLFAAIFWPKRWRMKYRMEIFFVALLAALMYYADRKSTEVYTAYQKDMIGEETVSGQIAEAVNENFDRTLKVLAFQWGFVFVTEDNEISRNAAVVGPNERVLFRLLSNDVIHGFNIPAADIVAELDPGEERLVWIRAPSKPGKYLIQCMNYCGVGHAQMKAWLVVSDELATAKKGSAEKIDGA